MYLYSGTIVHIYFVTIFHSTVDSVLGYDMIINIWYTP